MWLRGVRSSLIAIRAAPATFEHDHCPDGSHASRLGNPVGGFHGHAGLGMVPSTVRSRGASATLRVNGRFALNGVLRGPSVCGVPIGGRQAAARQSRAASVGRTILVGTITGCSWPLLSVAESREPLFQRSGPDVPASEWRSRDPLRQDASPFGGLHELYGGRVYPTGWHAFVALFARYDSIVRLPTCPPWPHGRVRCPLTG